MLDLKKVIELVQNNDFKGAQTLVQTEKIIPPCSSNMTLLLSKLTDTDFDTADAGVLEEITTLAATIAPELTDDSKEAVDPDHATGDAPKDGKEEDTGMMQPQPSVMLGTADDHGDHHPTQLGASHVDSTSALLLGGVAPTATDE